MEKSAWVSANGLSCEKPEAYIYNKGDQQTQALLGLAWVEIAPSSVEGDRHLGMLGIAEAAGHAPDLLNLATEFRWDYFSLARLLIPPLRIPLFHYALNLMRRPDLAITLYGRRSLFALLA